MIRQARPEDLDAVEALYGAVQDVEAARGFCYTKWRRGFYPTRETAQRAMEAGELYIDVEEGCVLAAVVVNGRQSPEYAQCPWKFPAEAAEVGVLHTLCVHPKAQRQGRAGALVRYAEQLCREQGKRVMRLDTRVGNLPGRRLYPALGFREAGQVQIPLTETDLAWMQLYEKAL